MNRDLRGLVRAALFVVRPMPKNRAFIVLISAAAIIGISLGVRQANGLFQLSITGELGVGREVFGFAIALGFLAFGLAQPFVGLVADRFGPHKVVFVGGLVYATGLAATTLAGGAFGLYASLGALIGLAMAMTTYTIVFTAIARAYPPERRGFASGVATAVGSFGMFAFVPITQWLISGLGWTGALYVLAAVVLLMCGFGFGLRPPKSAAGIGADDTQTLGEALREAGGHRGFWLLTVGFFVCGFHVAFIGTHLPAYFLDAEIEPATAATAFAMIGLVNIAGSLFFGMMGDRFRKKYVLSCIYICRAGVFALFLVLPMTGTTAIVLSAAIGFLWLGTVPQTNGLVAQVFGVKDLATLAGIVFMTHQFGSFLGAWLGGRVYDATGSYDAVWIASIVLGLFAALLHWPIADAPVARLQAARG